MLPSTYTPKKDFAIFVKNILYMKTIHKKNKTQFNIRLNEEEFYILRSLKEKHAVNISQLFKNFLKNLLDKMGKGEKYENAK